MIKRRVEITPDLMMRAYRAGLFPMAEGRTADKLYWLDPELRGVLPLDGFHMPRRLMRKVLSGGFTVTSDTNFPGVITGCAAPREGRWNTWINVTIEQLFIELHQMGHAHSVETWRDGVLVGGLYGVVLGGAFFGESMFSSVNDASKVALAHLVARLRLGGFTLLDTQFVTSHLARFGTIELPRDDYKIALASAVDVPARWLASPEPVALSQALRNLAERSRESEVA